MDQMAEIINAEWDSDNQDNPKPSRKCKRKAKQKADESDKDDADFTGSSSDSDSVSEDDDTDCAEITNIEVCFSNVSILFYVRYASLNCFQSLLIAFPWKLFLPEEIKRKETSLETEACGRQLRGWLLAVSIAIDIKI